MIKMKTQKYAFVQKNFRRLNFESRVLFFAHALTLVFCFFPWIGVEPLYGDPYYRSAFVGHIWLMGAFIFLISLAGVGVFLDELLEKSWFRWRVSKNKLFFVAGIQQLILIVSAWSVLQAESRGFENSQIRFGFWLCAALQLMGIVAVCLRSQQAKKESVTNFFQPPTQTKPTAKKTRLPLTMPEKNFKNPSTSEKRK